MLTALVGVLLLVNVGLFLYGKPKVNYDINNYCYYIVLNVQDDYVELKERVPETYSDSKATVYTVRREGKEGDIWNNVENGDVVMVKCVPELLAEEVNSSDKVIDLKIINVLEVY